MHGIWTENAVYCGEFFKNIKNDNKNQFLFSQPVPKQVIGLL